jgi:hypothetical protein
MNSRTIIGAILVATITLFASACSKAPESEGTQAPVAESASPTPSEIPAPAPVAAPVLISKDSPIWFEPEAISECAKAETAKVHWNAAGFPGVTTVEVLIADSDGKEILFAATGVINEKQTGPWARGGTEFILRDKATSTELARAKIPSLPCETP